MNAAIQELISRTHYGTPYFRGFSDSGLQISAVTASMCNHPIKVRATHKYAASHIDLYVPCRKCVQCRNTSGNDLTTRFFQDSNLLQHAYFVTLTYPSFRNFKDVPAALAPSFYHKDNYNSEHKDLFSPCLLYYPHIQQFTKVFRQKLTRFYGHNVYLEFICVGELGHKFGRPHWHILYISDFDIPYDILRDSWYYVIQSEARIDFQDIVSNGTLYAREDLSSSLTSKRSTKKCVKYIVKYTQKSDYKRSNLTRLRYAIPDLLNAPNHSEYICNNQTVFLYEKNKQRLVSFSSSKGIQIPDLSEADLYSLFGTHKRLSSVNAIGKVYAIQNLPRFDAGNKKLQPVPTFTPTLHSDQLSSNVPRGTTMSNCFPSYYSRLLSRYRFPLCICKKNFKGVTQYHFLTLQDCRSLNLLWYLHLSSFPRIHGDSVGQQYLTRRPSRFSDFESLGINLSEDQLRLLFPDKVSETRITLHDTDFFYPCYLYRWDTSTRYSLYTYLRYGQIYSFALVAQRYNRHTRSLSEPLVVNPKTIIRNLLYKPLLKYRNEYELSLRNVKQQSSLLDFLLTTPEWCNAVESNQQLWSDFKHQKDTSTLRLNPYD